MKIQEILVSHNGLGEHPNRHQNGTHSKKERPKGVRKAIPRALNLAGRAPRIWSHRAFNFAPLAHQNPLRKWHLDSVLIQKKTCERAEDLPLKKKNGVDKYSKMDPGIRAFPENPKMQKKKKLPAKKEPKPEPKTLTFLSPKP